MGYALRGIHFRSQIQLHVWNQAGSGISQMALWQFRQLNPNDNSGASTVDDNFADEQRSSADILVRETIQNPLDARSEGRAVRVRYSIATVQSGESILVRSLFQKEWLTHAAAAERCDERPLPDRLSFLIIEDFGTSGLEGTYSDSSVDGETENWNAFWFREGEGAKKTRSNGGAGQGKITLFLASQIRTVLAITTRRSDSKELMFGCTRFKRNYKLPSGHERWAKEARWGSTKDPEHLAHPVEDASLIRNVKQELGLHRGDHPGTSFIIPLPHEDTITEELIKLSVINEFFFAISRGHLSVEIGDTTLTASSIEGAADAIGDRCRLTKEYREFLKGSASLISDTPSVRARKGWNKSTKLTDENLDSASSEAIKATFESGQPIVAEFPVTVRPKTGSSIPSVFRVVLQQAGEGAKTEELFVRQDLAIDSEKKLTGYRAALPVRSLTYIDEQHLSDLLVCAEEPTHRSWNSKRQKVQAKYTSPEDVLHAVRNAAVRLLALIAPAGRRDETALSLYFADPSADSGKQKGASGALKDKNPSGGDGPKEIPPPKPKPLRLTPKTKGFTVVATPIPGSAFVPIDCSIEVAYATVTGNSYKQWDSADFWLPDEKLFKADGRGISAITRGGNTLHFRLLGEQSIFGITGFDPERQLDIRLKYKEVSDGSDVENI